MVKTDFAERLKAALFCSEVSQTKLAKELAARGHKISNSLISALTRGTRNMPRRYTVALMAQILSVSEDWLYSGAGEMKLPTKTAETIEFKPVPLIEARENMDLSQEIATAKLSMKFHKTRSKPAADAFAARVLDTACWPEFKPATAERDADVVVVAPGLELKPGDFVYIAARVRGKTAYTIRQYAEPEPDRVELVPLNRLHARYALGAMEGTAVEIVGKIVEVSRVF